MVDPLAHLSLMVSLLKLILLLLLVCSVIPSSEAPILIRLKASDIICSIRIRLLQATAISSIVKLR